MQGFGSSDRQNRGRPSLIWHRPNLRQVFPPMTTVEIVSRPFRHANAVVLEARLRKNLSDLTVDEMMGKMMHSHLRLLQTLVDDYRRAPPAPPNWCDSCV